MPTIAVVTTTMMSTMMSPAEAVAYLRQTWHLRVDEDEVRRWVRHGRVAGAVDDRGRVTVDAAAVDALCAVTSERQYGRCSPMVPLEEIVDGVLGHQEPVSGALTPREG